MIDLDRKCRKGFKGTYTGRKQYIGNGVTELSRDAIAGPSSAKGIAVIMTEPVFPTIPFLLEDQTTFFLQNIPSALVAHVLDVSIIVRRFGIGYDHSFWLMASHSLTSWC